MESKKDVKIIKAESDKKKKKRGARAHKKLKLVRRVKGDEREEKVLLSAERGRQVMEG